MNPDDLVVPGKNVLAPEAELLVSVSCACSCPCTVPVSTLSNVGLLCTPTQADAAFCRTSGNCCRRYKLVQARRRKIGACVCGEYSRA